jgi:hypothetical protein
MKIGELRKVLENYPDEYEAVINIGGEYAEIDEESINCIHSERSVELMEIG